LLGVGFGVWVRVRNGAAARKKDESMYQEGIKQVSFLELNC